MMKFKELQDKLGAKKYNPLPKKQVNQMVMENRDLDKVANSCQRLAIKAMSGRFRFDETPDSILMEYFQVCNAALAEALIEYTEDKIDFAYYAFVHMQNAMTGYYKSTSNVVKSRIIDKVRYKASYLHIDAPINEEEDGFDIPHQEEHEVASISLKMLYELIKEEHHLFRPHYLDVYAAYIGLDGRGGRMNKEVAEEFGMSNQRVAQIIKDVEKKMRESEKVLAYLAEF